MGAVVRVMHALTLCSLVVLAVTPAPPAKLALIPPPPYEVDVAGQIADFPCQPTIAGRVPSSALVVDAAAVPGGVMVGRIVRAESFDVAYRHAKAGAVWVEKWCR